MMAVAGLSDGEMESVEINVCFVASGVDIALVDVVGVTELEELGIREEKGNDEEPGNGKNKSVEGKEGI